MDPSGGRVTLLKLEVGKCNWEEFPNEARGGDTLRKEPRNNMAVLPAVMPNRKSHSPI
jgi:hypothetical protein